MKSRILKLLTLLQREGRGMELPMRILAGNQVPDLMPEVSGELTYFE